MVNLRLSTHRPRKVTGATYNQGFGNSVSFKLTANVTVEAVFEKIPVQPPLFPGFGLPGFGIPGYGFPGYGFPW
ncbi:MAG: hypothetical protein LBN71_07650 [Tannerella sp.]|jgi:hypothetical protein|nr:hypothetical protein [Tannerella sp.]